MSDRQREREREREQNTDTQTDSQCALKTWAGEEPQTDRQRERAKHRHSDRLTVCFEDMSRWRTSTCCLRRATLTAVSPCCRHIQHVHYIYNNSHNHKLLCSLPSCHAQLSMLHLATGSVFICLSICPSHAGIDVKLMTVATCGFHCRSTRTFWCQPSYLEYQGNPNNV